jgi:nitric oxide reductase NorE protein
MTTKQVAARARARHVPGEPEFWIFIFGDLAVFGLFFGIWSWHRQAQAELFAWGHEHLNQGFGLVNTLLLITSSALVAHGLVMARRGRDEDARRAYHAAAALGAAFVIVKFFEYRQHLGADGVDLHNDFFIGYFVFTGIHLVHVLVGLLGLMLAVTRSRLGGSDRDLRLLECVSVYWHMVDLVWIVWFYLIYLI